MSNVPPDPSQAGHPINGTSPDLTGIDPELINLPSTGIDFPGCFHDLVTADKNGDGYIYKNEYLGFIQTYGANRRCWHQDALTLQQDGAFNSLACICRNLEGSSPNCCLGSNARLPTAGALTPSTRTEVQYAYLTAICVVTDATIGGHCPPVILTRETPPPVLITPVSVPSSSSGLSNGAKWGIIAAAAALLLLCCCCCCVFKRRRAKALEEEQEDMVAKTTEAMEMAPEESGAGGAAVVPMVVPLGTGQGYGGDDDTESYDGDGRRRTGYNYAEDEDDPTKRRLGGYGEVPEGGGGDSHALRPIPDREHEEDPEWDYPGRNVNEPHRDPEDMSGQEFDPYNPDGGVYDPQHPPREPVGPPNLKWERLKKDEPDEVDPRKHRIQAGLGEGEVWDKLDEDEESSAKKGPSGDVFDWVVQSALGVLDSTNQMGHLEDDESQVP